MTSTVRIPCPTAVFGILIDRLSWDATYDIVPIRVSWIIRWRMD